MLRPDGNVTAHCYQGHKLANFTSVVLPDTPAGPADLPPADGQQGVQLTSAAAAAADAPTAAAAPATLAPALRADTYVYREGADIRMRPYRPLPTWRLAAAPATPQRLILHGDSTIKRTFMNLLALARFPCNMSVWQPRLHLEQWRIPLHCVPKPSGEADPLLEGLLKGCSAGAELATVPMGITPAIIVKWVM